MLLPKQLSSLERLLPIVFVFTVQLRADEPLRAVSLENARFDSVATDKKSFTVTDCPANCDGAVYTIYVSDTGPQADFGAFQKGDHLFVRFEVQRDTNQKEKRILQTLHLRSFPVAKGERIVVWLASALLYLGLAGLMTKFRPLKLVIGEDGRYSNSKIQMAVWFGVVIATYLATIYLRVCRAGWEFLGGVNIPENLLLLSGMSALTFGGAKGITTAKVDAAIAAGQANPKNPVGVQPNFWRDLIQNDAGQLRFWRFSNACSDNFGCGHVHCDCLQFSRFDRRQQTDGSSKCRHNTARGLWSWARGIPDQESCGERRYAIATLLSSVHLLGLKHSRRGGSVVDAYGLISGKPTAGAAANHPWRQGWQNMQTPAFSPAR
jgi:hypothetical protein